MPDHLNARRALAHPLWWVALALLALNDHLFKGQGVLPAALTGKLSDFAGLLVAPALLAALLGVERRRGWIAAHLAVGLGFSAINLSPTIARAVEAATLPTPFPWWITVDPTDLVALPMLALSAILLGRHAARPVALRPLAARLAAALGGLACVATSPPPEPVPVEPFFGADTEAALMLANRTDAAVIVRVRRLAPEILIGCAAVADDPTATLAPDLFDAPSIWSLEPGRALGLPTSGVPRAGCDAFLLDGATGSRLVFVDSQQWPLRAYPSGGEALAGPHVIDLGAEGLAPHPALFPAPHRETLEPLPACATPPVGAGLDWTELPYGPGTIAAHTVSADGCHALDIQPAGRSLTRWYLCAPGVPLHFDVDEPIIVRAIEDRVVIELERGTIELTKASAPPAGYLLEPEPSEGCGPHRNACDGAVLPLALRHGPDALVAGERLQLIDGRTLYALRAERALVADPRCEPADDPARFQGPFAADRFELVVTDLTAETAR
ncbi:MAG: hypothetical protein R3F65_01665 [bacterium]